MMSNLLKFNLFLKQHNLTEKKKGGKSQVFRMVGTTKMGNVMGRLVKKNLGEMGFNMSGGPVNWFPGHMASATRAIRDRLKLADLVIEVRDARVSSLSYALIAISPCACISYKIVNLTDNEALEPYRFRYHL